MCIKQTLDNLPRNEVEKNELVRFWNEFMIDNQSKWMVFGTGSAILAAFLTLAGAAWSLNLTNVLYLNILSSIYWFFIYILIYIDITWGIYHRMINALTPERQTIIYIIFSFGIFLLCYKLMFTIKGNLVNPLLVVGQLSCIFYNFKYPLKPDRIRYLCLLCLFLSVISSLYLQEIDWQILCLFIFDCVILINILPFDCSLFFILSGHLLDPELAKWGFYLAFQQVGYYTVSFFLDNEMRSSIHKIRYLSFLLLLIIEFYYVLNQYKDFDFVKPEKLAALLLGACIIFISLKRRTKWQLRIALLLILLISIFIGIMSAPSAKTIILGNYKGIFIFVFLHIWLYLSLLFFKDSLARRKQVLVPIFFSAIFIFIRNFPELNWLEKWISGLDLLLLIIGFFNFVEDEKSYQITTITKTNSRKRRYRRSKNRSQNGNRQVGNRKKQVITWIRE